MPISEEGNIYAILRQAESDRELLLRNAKAALHMLTGCGDLKAREAFELLENAIRQAEGQRSSMLFGL